MASSRSPLRVLALAAILAALHASHSLAQTDTGEARLRAALRAAVTQQRALEDENATLRAKGAEDARKLDALTLKADEATQQLGALQQDLNDHLQQEQKLGQTLDAAEKDAAASRGALGQVVSNLAKWQAAYKEAADAARTRDADAKRFEAQLAQTTQRADDCSSRNAALFKIGNELLARYEGKGVFSILLEGEPVTQLKRVELENLIQDYQDKLLDEKIAPPAQ